MTAVALGIRSILDIVMELFLGESIFQILLHLVSSTPGCNMEITNIQKFGFSP